MMAIREKTRRISHKADPLKAVQSFWTFIDVPKPKSYHQGLVSTVYVDANRKVTAIQSG